MQQLMHQSQQQHQHGSPRFAQQHAQNMHQRQLIQQMQQQQQQQNMSRHMLPGGGGGGMSYQQYQQQARQAFSRSQIDLPSTSRQELRVAGQEVYYHYAQSRPRYGVPQVYMKATDNGQAVIVLYIYQLSLMVNIN